MDAHMVFWKCRVPCFLFFIWSLNCGVCVEVTVPRDPVMQQKGSNVEIPCHYKTSVGKNFVLEWRFAGGSTAPDAGTQILYFANDVLYKPSRQADRLSLLNKSPTLGDASIQLNNIRASDAGTYICEVNNPPDFDGTGTGLVNLVVLMPPSTPVCKGSTSGHIGSDVTFSCSSSEGVPTPIYSWTLLDSKQPLPTSHMVQNQEKGTLVLTNLTLQLSGTYRCTATNEFGHHSCQISLHVTGVSKAGAVAGALIGAILALFLLGAIVLYILRYRRNRLAKKKPQSEYSGNEIREDATAPGIFNPKERRDSKSESQLLENVSSRPGSASTTKSHLKNLII
ncbi:V-set and immunoglobulin domain-containing protein 2 [Notechis scutatus]|uniref:V-set and immunoglobulin domain-containing protein 2 n=1 Tax=Notechis scutatus TaxID=8663 RepID=UPI000E783CC8|nr:V-set and immunoglobulin domain-containing protein 2 [Notechis scutatus]